MSRVVKDREERREELVETAMRLFGERGIDETAVSDIVGAVRVSQGTFYWYFESKGDLVNAVVEHISERIVAGVIDIASEVHTNAVDKILHMRDELMSVVIRDRELLEFFHRAGNEAFHDRVSRDTVRRLVPEFERAIDQGVEEHVFSILHSDDAARFIAALLDVTDPFDVFSEPERLGHHVEAITEFAFRGLGCDEETLAYVLARPEGGG